MTIDEAINVLRWLNPPRANKNSFDNFVKAIEMAIDALEFRERYDYFWEEVKSAGMKGKEIEIHHSGRAFRIREVAQ